MDEVVRLVAYAFKRNAHDTRVLLGELEAAGVFVTYRETSGEMCPCGYHYAGPNGLCAKCEAEEAAFAAREAIDAEHRKLEDYTKKLRNVLKQQLKRLRAKYLANPRDEENKTRWEIAKELLADIEAIQSEVAGEEEDYTEDEQ